MQWVELAMKILAALIPEIVKLVKSAMANGDDAEALRKQPLTVSIAFGGEPGGSVSVLVDLESGYVEPVEPAKPEEPPSPE